MPPNYIPYFFIDHQIKTIQDMCAINDPLGQTHSPASSDHYSRLKVLKSCFVLRDFEMWGRTYGLEIRIPLQALVKIS